MKCKGKIYISAALRRTGVERKENYAKSIKNWLTVISSVSFLVSTYKVATIDAVFLYAFTYLSSIGLAFYNLTPQGNQAKIRRKRMIEFAIASVAFIFIGITLGTIHPIIKMSMLYLIKATYVIFAVLAVIYTFKDDLDTESIEEKDAKSSVRKSLQEQEKTKPFKEREKRSVENKRIRKFLLKKKDSRSREDIR
ncbi:hypothetical protein CUZ89_1904 [Enterococcus xinjiangensis]|nr:hypothetical protein [Enterococcus lactis]